MMERQAGDAERILKEYFRAEV